MYAEDIPHRAKAVYMYLKDRANRSGTCWPGINTIAKDLHLSRSTVKRALGDLTRRGFIKKEPCYRENGSNSSNLYSVQKIKP
ncbi:MAG: helix-turn-helix domain-containing protein [Oscillibacter sp.]|nr:helix-turn-helix domain-containing protein [Oscillibacter sp.]